MANPKKIAVLGGGNGGHTMAADLTLKGYQVVLCEDPAFKEGISATLERQSIELIDLQGKKHTVRPHLVTTDFRAALDGAGYVMLTIPAIGTRRFFELMAPHLEDGQVVVKWSGNFSALALAQMLRERGIKERVILGETHTLPWACRLVAPGTVQIFLEATRLLFATQPAGERDGVMAHLKTIYPLEPAQNVLETSFNNLNPIVHPVGTIMNAGWIDTISKGFYFYRDGVTPSTARGIKAVYEEARRLAQAIGIKMMDYPEEDFWRKSAIMSSYFRASFDKEGQVAQVSGPSSLTSRYIAEDVPFGLVPLASLARQFGVETPVINGVIELASAANQADYRKDGLTLKELGLANLARDGVASLG